MNSTAAKFGYPQTLLREYQHWLVLLRPQQVTLGSLVLVCTEPVTQFAEVSVAGFAELRDVVGNVERTLKQLYDFQKINYLMLMMIDPDVHFHVFPRYETLRNLEGEDIVDHGWPGPPALGEFVELGAEAQQLLVQKLRQALR